MNLVRIIVVLIWLVPSVPVSHASEMNSPSEASLYEFIDLIKIRNRLNLVVDSIIANAPPIDLPAGSLPKQRQKILQDMRDEQFTLLRSDASWNTVIRPRVMDMYRQFFTQRDVDEIIQFIKTPAGVQMISFSGFTPSEFKELSDFLASDAGSKLVEAEGDVSRLDANTMAAAQAFAETPAGQRLDGLYSAMDEQSIAQIESFYKSPVGSKWVSMDGYVQEHFQAVWVESFQALKPQWDAIMNKHADRLEALGRKCVKSACTP